MTVGVHMLPKFPRDTTDRNRTSPFAFTGNKFEFRMLGSSASISTANVVLNTIVAESLRQFADELEGAENFQEALHELIVKTIREHRRIIFNGNNYSPEWVEEAAKRGLLKLDSTVDALQCYTAEKNIRIFATHKVLSESELRSRRDIGLDAYAKITGIEAKTMLMMARRQILPAVIRYTGEMAEAGSRVHQFGARLPHAAADGLVEQLCTGCDRLSSGIDQLALAMDHQPAGTDPLQSAAYMHDTILPRMAELRAAADTLERITDRKAWPFPTYDELLFQI